jgi:hypothetical protein
MLCSGGGVGGQSGVLRAFAQRATKKGDKDERQTVTSHVRARPPQSSCGSL